MFWEFVKNLKKELSLRQRVMMLKTAILIDTDRVISAIVDRHESRGDQLFNRVKLNKKDNNQFLLFLFKFNTNKFLFLLK